MENFGETGMLYFDDSKRSMLEKVVGAASYYERKHGVKPTWCKVSMGSLTGAGEPPAGIKWAEMKIIRPNHLWLGID